MSTQRRKFHSVPLRRSAQYDARHTTSAHVPAITRQVPQTLDEDEDDEQAFMIPRIPSSTVRYTDEYGRQVVQQGKRRYVMEKGPPPARQRTRRHFNWLAIFGAGMTLMIFLVLLMNWIGAAWQEHQLDAQYGNPRTWQTDQVLGIDHDSAQHPSHLIFENLNGRVFFEIIPAGDFKQARIYPVTTLYGQDAASTPITADFRDVTGNGRLDIIVHLGTQGNIIFLNNGSTFSPEPGGTA